jgi:PilZ domain-containing protein
MARPSQPDAQGCVCVTERSRYLPVNVMAQETDEGLAYLQALKGSAPTPAARADPESGLDSAEGSERAPAQTSAAPQTFALEKRPSPRYASEGSMVNTPPHEADEGLAYLQALKQAAPTAVAVAPARGPNSGDAPWRAQVHNSAGPQTFVLEKRRSPRYKCEGSVEICQEGFELRTWATCTDVSMHGCYVEATTTYAVGTNVHVKLQANEFHVESTGCVRVAYPCLGMGIAFGEMSEENRTRLRALLRTISRPSVILGAGTLPSAPWGGPLMSISLPADATAALRALAEFFESRQLLMRDEFLRILRKSQDDAKPPEQGQGPL